MRVLFLTKYSRNGASSRYRTFQYISFFEENGIKCLVCPLFDEKYLTRIYKYGHVTLIDLVKGFMRRIIVLLGVRKYDVLVIEKEVFPYTPAIFERMFSWMGVRYIVDYDDALFHQYDRHRNPIVKALLGNKIAAVMRNARLVVAGNQYLSAYARKVGVKHVKVIPTVIDLERYPFPNRGIESAIFTVGWIGSPSTTKHIQNISSVLEIVCAEGARLRLVGSGVFKIPGIDMKIRPWSEEREVEQICSFDVGVMPLPDEPWARGKCGFKLIQYMACGLPVIASPVGVNCEIVEHGVNGFLAETKEEWIKALNMLRNNPDLRKTMGLAGREKVEKQYCFQITAPRLASLLRSVAAEGK